MQLQACATQLGDEYPFRVHWPCQQDLRVNGTPYRCASRPPSQKLGRNMRDAPANLSIPHPTPLVTQGLNRLVCWTYDARPFALFVQLVHRRSEAQVRAMIPPPLGSKEEQMRAAVKRVRSCGDGEGGDTDSDDVVALSSIVSLK